MLVITFIAAVPTDYQRMALFILIFLDTEWQKMPKLVCSLIGQDRQISGKGVSRTSRVNNMTSSTDIFLFSPISLFC